MNIAKLICLIISIGIINFLNAQNEYKIDSIQSIINDTHNDSIKIVSYGKLYEYIYDTDSELELLVFDNIENIAIKNIGKGTYSSDMFFGLYLARALNNKGAIYDHQGKYKDAIEYYYKSLLVSEKIGKKAIIAISYNNIGNIYLNLENYTDALENFQLCLEIASELEYDYVSSTTHQGIGQIYVFKADSALNAGSLVQKDVFLDSAIFHQKESLRRSIDEGDTSSIVSACNDLCKLYLKTRQNSKALEYASESLKIAEEAKKDIYLAIGHEAFAHYHMEINDLRKAVFHAEKSLLLSEQSNRILEQINATTILYECYNELGNAKLALQFLESNIRLQESKESEDNERATFQQKYEYLYEKQAIKDSLIFLNEQNLKDKEIEKQEVKLKAEQSQKYVLLLFAVLIAIFALILFRNYIGKKRDNTIITKQKKEVEEHRRKILESINYAENIQQAMLPPEEEIKKLFPGFSKLYLPKDIVSGDFYWFYHLDNISYLAIADCTGHGVPGAFMSMIGSTQLNDIIIDSKEKNLETVLNDLDEGIRNLLKQYDENASEDGMEIGIIKINHLKNEIEFAGAGLNLYVMSESMEIVKGNLRSIGGWIRKRSRLPEFTTHKFQLNNVHVIYLFTDGFEDQFGNEDGEKFGRNRLIDELNQMQNIPDMEHLKKVHEKWKGVHQQLDDVSVIALKLDPTVTNKYEKI